MSELGITRLQTGSIFAGDYRIVSPLSQGGMGAVFVAEQQSTGKPRALKVMLPQLVADPGLRRRFEQEARVGAQIASEHVVEVVGAGVDAPTGMPWLAMELLRGEDLAQTVARRGPLPPLEVVAIYEQLCHALGAAHAAGIVHRDLKPENIYLAEAHRAGAAFTVKVLDFGIAKITQEAQTGQTAAMGSPMWMAPEQTERSPVTAATDIWPLGLIAFFLLTGVRFWRAAQNDEMTVMQLMREMLFEPIPLASARAAEVGARVPPGFDGWFARCVARSPQGRFPSAQVAFAELRACVTDPARAAGGRLAVAPTELAPAARTPTVVETPGWSGPPAAPQVASAGFTGPAAHGPLATAPGAVRAYTPAAVQTAAPPAARASSSNTGKVVLIAIGTVCALGVLGIVGVLVADGGDGPQGAALGASAGPLPPVAPGAFGLPAPGATLAPGATPSPNDVPAPAESALGAVSAPSATPGATPARPHASPSPNAAAPATTSLHVGRWSCIETADLSFSSPLGTAPRHSVVRSTATVVENADHTLTTTYANGSDICVWHQHLSGATAVAFPQQQCHTSEGGLIILNSAVGNANATTSQTEATMTFRRYAMQFGIRTEYLGIGSLRVQCTRQ